MLILYISYAYRCFKYYTRSGFIFFLKPIIILVTINYSEFFNCFFSFSYSNECFSSLENVQIQKRGRTRIVENDNRITKGKNSRQNKGAIFGNIQPKRKSRRHTEFDAEIFENEQRNSC